MVHKIPNGGIPGAAGVREFFGFGQSTLGWNELTNSKTFSNPITKDISFMFRITGGTETNFLAPETTQYAPGLMFDLNLPGVVEVGVAAYKEYTHNSFDACGPAGAFSGVTYVGFNGPCIGGGAFSGDRDFEWTWKVFTFISEPLTFLPPSLPITWINIMNITGPKGTGLSTANCAAIGCAGTTGPVDAFGVNETKVEVFEDTRLSLDASKVFWGKPGSGMSMAAIATGTTSSVPTIRLVVQHGRTRHVDRKHGLRGNDLSLQVIFGSDKTSIA